MGLTSIMVFTYYPLHISVMFEHSGLDSKYFRVTICSILRLSLNLFLHETVMFWDIVYC